jgi:hypothetical protein
MATIFGSLTPANLGNQDNQATLGVVFTVSTNDQTATGIRYYKGRTDGDNILRLVALRNGSGTIIASGTRTQLVSDPIGWITVPFTIPVALSSSITYTATYNTGAASKSYANTPNDLANAVSNPPLATPATAGRWLYSAPSTAGDPTTLPNPTNTSTTNYFVDIVTQGANQAPTANAGTAQTNIEPWSTVTLSGTDSDSDGTVVTRAWAQTSGTAVTLSGAATATAIFTAPASIAGETLSFSYTVTDNLGATGTSSTNVTILPVTERTVIGGAEVPLQIRAN